MTRPADIAPDMIVEILLRLPVKSSLRFKCVSKSWNSLFSSPAFARMHLKRAWQTKILTSTPSGLSLLDYETSFRNKIQLDFSPRRQNHRVRIMGSCHGLVALALEDSKDFFIWNPLTGDYKKLPDPCFPSPMESHNHNFPSTENSLFHGFGYDSSTDDYKLLFSIQRSRWLRPPETSSFRKETKVAIFSLRKSSWKMIESHTTNTLFFPHQNLSGCFVNGALNWLSGKRRREEILTFDLKTERFGRVAVPNHGSIGFIIVNMGVLDGRLCLTYYNLEFYFRESISSYACPVELWVMKQYGVKESWTKLLTIVDKYNSWHLPLCVSKGKEVIVLNEQKDLIRYDAEESILEKFRICKCHPENFKYCLIFEHSCQAIVYAESLLSPDANIIEDEQQNQGRFRKRKNML